MRVQNIQTEIMFQEVVPVTLVSREALQHHLHHRCRACHRFRRDSNSSCLDLFDDAAGKTTVKKKLTIASHFSLKQPPPFYVGVRLYEIGKTVGRECLRAR